MHKAACLVGWKRSGPSYFEPPHTKLPSRYSKAAFYIVRFFVAVVAGGLALAYGIDKPLLALHIEAATPLIVQTFAQTRPGPPSSAG